MSIFELGVRPDRDNDFADVARQTISASVDHEEGTLAMYALQRSDNPRQAFMVEFYENESAYRKHLNAAPYKAFAARAPDIIDRKKKITLEPQFLGDKHIIANERTINNLVIVELNPWRFSVSIQNSLCFGLLDGTRQIGFARLVTDFATFGYLCDVYVLNDYQKSGLGRWLIECCHAHPLMSRLRRIMLVTDSAPWLY